MELIADWRMFIIPTGIEMNENVSWEWEVVLLRLFLVSLLCQVLYTDVLRTCGSISVYDFTSKDDFVIYLKLLLLKDRKLI